MVVFRCRLNVSQERVHLLSYLWVGVSLLLQADVQSFLVVLSRLFQMQC